MKKYTAKTNHQQGYSLIELIVTIAIIGILSAVGVISFSNYNQVQQVSQTASNIELLLNQARGNAQSIVKEFRTVKNYDGSSTTLVDCFDNITLTTLKLHSYSVERRTDGSGNNFMVMYLNCGDTSISFSREARHVKLTDMAFGSPVPPVPPLPPCGVIRFEALNAKATLGASSPCQITITKSGYSKTIQIDSSGNVKQLN